MRSEYVPIGFLRPDDGRSDVHADFDAYGADALLVEDIARHGVLVPLVVVQDGKRYIVQDGRRRLLAARLIGLDELPCVVVDRPIPGPSLALGRQQGTYARIVACRKRIERLIAAERNADTDRHLHVERDWQALERATGLCRRTLRLAMRILAYVETLDDSTRGVSPSRGTAERIRTEWRNHGLSHALRMCPEIAQAERRRSANGQRCPDVPAVDWGAYLDGLHKRFRYYGVMTADVACLVEALRSNLVRRLKPIRR
jgi:hypothetical protein